MMQSVLRSSHKYKYVLLNKFKEGLVSLILIRYSDSDSQAINLRMDSLLLY